MRVVVQRVKHASVTINGTVNGKNKQRFLSFTWRTIHR